MEHMFEGCILYNQPLPDTWDTSNVTNMSYMLSQCKSFNQLLPDNWDIAQVTNMSFMFYGCTSFNQKIRWNLDMVITHCMLTNSFGIYAPNVMDIQIFK